MPKSVTTRAAKNQTLPKAATGIHGLDEITNGGLPRGRPTLVCGSAGCGKTLLAMEFIVRGAMEFNEPGVFMAFEETSEELMQNVRSLGFDLDELVKQNKLLIDHVQVERSEIEETGEYDLEGLFIRLGHAIDSIGAKRVVLDTLETLFSGLSNAAILRSELRRLFRWLKDKGVTAVITGERGEGTLTRQGLEEYVSDCVIVLDHRVTEQLSTRRLRIVKYRGTLHGTNEYPFLIDETGIVVLPITSIGLQHEASTERISIGVPRLDTMLGGGIYRGTTVLISGTAGTGKTSLASHFADAACRRGEKCLYFAFEESESQLVRNMRSIGLDLSHWLKKGTLKFYATRPTSIGLESHLATMHKLVRDFQPRAVIVDPITTFTASGSSGEAELMLMRVIDFLKSEQITALFTSLSHSGSPTEASNVGVSSLIDTWLLLRDIELGGERNRGIYVLKSRGMAHSNQIREFLLTDHGVELRDVYVGPDGVLTGSMRLAQEARERAAENARQLEVERQKRELKRKRLALDAQIVSQRAQFEAEEQELKYASPAQMDLYGLVKGAYIQRLGDSFVSAFANSPSTALANLTPNTLYPQLISYVQLGGLVEAKIVGDVTAAARHEQHTNEIAAYVLVGAALVILLLAILLSWLSIRSVSRSLRGVSIGAARAAERSEVELRRVADDRIESVDHSTLEALPVDARTEVGDFARAFVRAQRGAATVVERQAAARRNLAQMTGTAGRRSAQLVARQTGIIDRLERSPVDPDVRDDLRRLDHITNRLRRVTSSLLTLAVAGDGGRHAADESGYLTPMALADVVKLALDEIESETRVDVSVPFGTMVAPAIIDDVVLLFAELLANAAAFSRTATRVRVFAPPFDSGVSIVDEGIGMSEDQLATVNTRLAHPERLDLATSGALGLFLVGRLARRHDLRVTFEHTPGGGVTVIVDLGHHVTTLAPAETARATARVAAGSSIPRPRDGRASAFAGASRGGWGPMLELDSRPFDLDTFERAAEVLGTGPTWNAFEVLPPRFAELPAGPSQPELPGRGATASYSAAPVTADGVHGRYATGDYPGTAPDFGDDMPRAGRGLAPGDPTAYFGAAAGAASTGGNASRSANGTRGRSARAGSTRPSPARGRAARSPTAMWTCPMPAVRSPRPADPSPA